MPLILLSPGLINAQSIQNKALLIKVSIFLKPQVLALVIFDNKIFVSKVLVVQSLPDHVLPENGDQFFLHEIVPFVLLDAEKLLICEVLEEIDHAFVIFFFVEEFHGKRTRFVVLCFLCREKFPYCVWLALSVGVACLRKQFFLFFYCLKTRDRPHNIFR